MERRSSEDRHWHNGDDWRKRGGKEDCNTCENPLCIWRNMRKHWRNFNYRFQDPENNGFGFSVALKIWRLLILIRVNNCVIDMNVIFVAYQVHFKAVVIFWRKFYYGMDAALFLTKLFRSKASGGINRESNSKKYLAIRQISHDLDPKDTLMVIVCLNHFPLSGSLDKIFVIKKKQSVLGECCLFRLCSEFSRY